MKRMLKSTFSTNNNICTGCLSFGRRLSPLTGAAREVFQQIVDTAVQGSKTDAVVCWECTARVHNVLQFRNTVEMATKILEKKNTDLSNLTSFSKLSSTVINGIINILHNEVTIMSENSPCFVKIEDDDLDTLINEDLANHDDDEIKPSEESVPIENTSKKRKKKKKSERKEDKTEFDASDEEPLASKSTVKPKSKDKEKVNKTESKRGRGRKEQSAGVVFNARVTAELARLGLPPGALHMVVLSWEEVEEERQRMLCSEKYLRHEHRCSRCAVGFNHRLKLQQHMNKHSPSAGAYECSWCGARSRAPHALAAHRRRHRVRWRCSVCDALWSRSAVAADHLRREHGAPAAAAHRCTHAHCTHAAPTLSKLRAHMKTHASSQTCSDCGKTFADRASLRTHLFSHRADREHVCSVCGAGFLYPRALRLHRLTHDRPAPLYCHQCDVAFKNPMSYYQHMKYSLAHVHPDKLKTRFNLAPVRAQLMMRSEMHANIVRGCNSYLQPRHACSYCGARFVRGARLAEHVAARHTRVLAHGCPHHSCTYKSASRAVLRAHIRSAHAPATNRRRLVCHRCGRTYTTKMSLENHLRSHSNSGPAPRAPPAPEQSHTTDIVDTHKDNKTI